VIWLFLAIRSAASYCGRGVLVPVFEHPTGPDYMFSKLSALAVKPYDDVTPGLIGATYADSASRAKKFFDSRRLKKSYWMGLVFGAAALGSAVRVIFSHPPDQGVPRTRIPLLNSMVAGPIPRAPNPALET
jgi:hypothetical protein